MLIFRKEVLTNFFKLRRKKQDLGIHLDKIMELEKDEKIILDDGPAGYRTKLTLTNKRLITQHKKGLFKTSWIQESEVFLDDIKEAYVKPGGVFDTMSTAMLKMKNGEDIQFTLNLSGSQTIGSSFAGDMLTDMNLRVKTLNDRWVNAINNQIIKQQIAQNRIQGSNCLNCRKLIPGGDFKFCPSCGKVLSEKLATSV